MKVYWWEKQRKIQEMKSRFRSGPVVQMSFKDISYLEFWRPFCSVEWHHLCNFGKGHYDEQFCEII